MTNYTSPHNLADSPFQYRRTYNESKLKEMAESMKSPVGMLQPIIVRRNTNPSITLNGAAVEFEVIMGHQRKRAAILAELDEVPYIEREMTDEEVKRAQLIENIQRDGVHAIEEAEGFERLMNDHAVTADELATQIGQSRSYVYGRLKLLKACPAVQQACLSGEIGTEVALLLARLPSVKVQEHALKAIAAQHLSTEDGGKNSYRRIRELLVDKYTLNLSIANF
jgi:ParB/RepB/Spo0J family partition protein